MSCLLWDGASSEAFKLLLAHRNGSDVAFTEFHRSHTTQGTQPLVFYSTDNKLTLPLLLHVSEGSQEVQISAWDYCVQLQPEPHAAESIPSILPSSVSMSALDSSEDNALHLQGCQPIFSLRLRSLLCYIRTQWRSGFAHLG